MLGTRTPLRRPRSVASQRRAARRGAELTALVHNIVRTVIIVRCANYNPQPIVINRDVL